MRGRGRPDALRRLCGGVGGGRHRRARAVVGDRTSRDNDRHPASGEEHTVTVERHSPGGRTAGPGYAEMAITTGVRLAWLAGQCPLDESGALVAAGDVAGQTRQVVANLRACMVDVGARPEHVVRTTVYVVGDEDALAIAWQVFRDSGVSGRPMAPSTLLGVQRLGHHGQLVEIDAIALLD
jgi:enamine deaminase RidA (YjgF/YER057c/UK114 family)